MSLRNSNATKALPPNTAFAALQRRIVGDPCHPDDHLQALSAGDNDARGARIHGPHPRRALREPRLTKPKAPGQPRRPGQSR